jgi:glycerate dehydrogenase
MKIVILDGYTENPGDLNWKGFEALGDAVVYDRTPLEKIVGRIGDAQIAITNKPPITRHIMASCPGLRYIGVLATGYNVVDVDAAKEIGIVITNIPTYGTYAVGQYAIALLLEICHHIGSHDQAVKEGRWEQNPDWCFWDYPLIELADKTMGIIGFGKIGQTTGQIAKALGMRIIAVDEYPTETGYAIGEYVCLDELLAQSDVISLHCPLLPSTEGIINQDTIGKMRNGVIILNNSRGQLIVEQDLANALNSGKVYAAGVDVVSIEPIQSNNPLLKAKNCIITPHISWASKESRMRLMDIAVENLRAFLAGAPVNVVNPLRKT